MGQAVVDTSFLAMANEALEGAEAGNLLHKRVDVLERIVKGQDQIRYNPKLLTEYLAHVKASRNDIVEQFLALLDDPTAIKVAKNNLTRQDKAKANTCRWPTHDQHVLAAAIGGSAVVIHVTENALNNCSACIKRVFGFKVNHIA